MTDHNWFEKVCFLVKVAAKTFTLRSIVCKKRYFKNFEKLKSEHFKIEKISKDKSIKIKKLTFN